MARMFIRLPAVIAETGLSRTTIYRLIGLGLWPHPVAIGLRAVGWPASEVEALNAARIAGRSADKIRELVRNLEDARQSLNEAA